MDNVRPCSHTEHSFVTSLSSTKKSVFVHYRRTFRACEGTRLYLCPLRIRQTRYKMYLSRVMKYRWKDEASRTASKLQGKTETGGRGWNKVFQIHAEVQLIGSEGVQGDKRGIVTHLGIHSACNQCSYQRPRCRTQRKAGMKIFPDYSM